MSLAINQKVEFLKIFNDLQLEAETEELFSDVLLSNVEFYRASKMLNIFSTSERFLSFKTIKDMEEIVMKTYSIDKIFFYISYREENIDSVFINNFYNYIKEYMAYKFPSINGFISESNFRIDKNTFNIFVKNKGKHMLKVFKCEEVLIKLLSNGLNKRYSICIHEESISEERYLEKKEHVHKKLINNIITSQEDTIKRQKKDNTEKISNIILGRKISEDSVPIIELREENNKYIVEGEVININARELKGGKFLFSFVVTDFISSITVKKFLDNKQYEDIKEKITKGKYVKIKGESQYDKYEREIVLLVYDIEETDRQERIDNAENKRVELHVHTQMSSMDGISSVGDIVKQAANWGHKAIAITDHGVVQAFPNAYYAAKKYGIKIIYGVECYLVNDSIPIVYDSYNASLDTNFVIFDIETTGLNPKKDKITEIGAVKIANGEIVDSFSSLINPQISIPPKITKLTGITDEMVSDAPLIEEVLDKFLDFTRDCILVAHNASFDVGFIKENARNFGMDFKHCVLDTLQLARELFPELNSHRLNIVAQHLKIKLDNHHRALDDAKATSEILLKCIDILREMGIDNVEKINRISKNNIDIKKLPYYHAILLVKNYEGLKNLYKLISKSHVETFYKKPRISKSTLMQYRDGILIGSACEAGELYRAFLEKKPYSEIENIAKFYNYLEIQPLGNNEFLIRDEKVKDVNEIKDINNKIVKLGEKLNKLVVATCDVHFLNPHEEIYRRILMSGQGYQDADNQAPLYLRTTDEMLEEFLYLGNEKAYEVVVDNTNKIADMIDEIRPVPEKKCPPKMENAPELIQEMSYRKAESIYGNPLPKTVKERMDKELNSIISNGFAVMYLIAQKLVAKSLEDGYLVGSRGSVGSSFIAFLCDITEVNALSPHYVCRKCRYSEFIIDGSYGCGADLPEKKCPECGELLYRDGHEIPFETFLGFDGDKEPDIDLNFSGDYQARAHKYTEELFGKDHVFRAGTIGTIAEKTAYGFVKNYFDEKDMVINNAEINRLVQGCTGVKRTTGQHPGGIIIVPQENEIFEFCPVQRPADDTNSDITTTHFDYHSIDQNLLKLDILGHDDPTVIKMLEDLSNVNAREIPLWDKDTMSIFTSTEVLGITSEDIDSEVGTFAIPEFGTKFVRQMLVDTKPTTFAELVRISGLSHGTDVWLNNAQELIRDDTASLSEVICTRDDIMVYLMQKGVPPKTAFIIMEKVRKGKGISEEEEQNMAQNNVPKWYIDSCKKIKYMFPKAHAVAYVTMAFRIAYFKVHFPEEFYIAYFTVRADDFDAEVMTKGRQKVLNKLEEIKKIGNNATQKEKNMLTILEVCNEMYARGIKFLQVDLYNSDAVKFIKTKEGILPPLNSLQGVGTNAAKSIQECRKDGEFISIDDLRIRSKVTKTVIEILQKHGCLKDLPETNQISLF